MEVIILRGLPGSGKSSWIGEYIIKHSNTMEEAASLFPICSADHYHIKVGGGKYDFKPENQGKAHLACLENFLYSLIDPDKDIHTIFVDNTNTTAVEIAPYWQLASLHSIPVKIVRIHCPYEIACRRNVHGVPNSIIWRMYQNLISERLPAHWIEEIVLGDQG